jgi:hypothetical protein
MKSTPDQKFDTIPYIAIKELFVIFEELERHPIVFKMKPQLGSECSDF